MATVGTVLLIVVACLAVAAFIIYRALNAEGEYFNSNGVRIHYRQVGEGVPVILIHGLAINYGANWIPPGVFWRLAKRYRVIAIDTRGHGRSDKPYDANEYGMKMVDDVVRLMDHLGIEKAHVVGYSFGGFMTLKMMTTHPERLLSAAPCGAGWSANPQKDLEFVRILAEALARGEGFKPLMIRLTPTGQRPNPIVVAVASFIICLFNDVKAMEAVARGMEQLEVPESALRGNQVPAMGIIGDRDPLKEFADQMADVTANFEYVVVPRGDHMTTLMYSMPKDRLDAFLAQHSPA